MSGRALPRSLARPAAREPTIASPEGEVEAFLRGLGLQQYADTLLSNGFYDIETLLCIEDSDLRDMGISPCHLVKLRRKLQELQRQGADKGCEAGEENPVVLFLREAGLGKYAQALLQSGFDEVETLLYMEDSDMKDLGIPRGHAMKLRRRLREIGIDAAQAPGSPPSGPRQPEASPKAAGGSGSGMAPTSPAAAGAAAAAAVRSWEDVQAHGVDEVARAFYQQLFRLTPEAEGLFPPEVRLKYCDWMAEEAGGEDSLCESPGLGKIFSKMLNAVGCTVAGLHDFGRLVPMLSQLGARHAGYGVSEAHWPLMGRALLAALRERLGAATFNAEAEAAWSTAFKLLSSVMVEGFRQASPTTCPDLKLDFSLVAPLSSPSPSSMGFWVEDCRSQGARDDLAAAAPRATATAVAPLELPCPARHRRLTRLWEDDSNSEASPFAGSPSWGKTAAGSPGAGKAGGQQSQEVMVFGPCASALMCEGFFQGLHECREDAQPLVAG